jgi:hypothetical protein
VSRGEIRVVDGECFEGVEAEGEGGFEEGLEGMVGLDFGLGRERRVGGEGGEDIWDGMD